MMAFAPLRALSAKASPSPLAAPRLSDPLADAICARLIGEKLWRYGLDLEVSRDGRNLTLRLHLPETRQCDRDLGRLEAQQLRDQLAAYLTAQRCAIRFADSWFSEKGRKEWVVLIKARSDIRRDLT